MGPPQNQRDGFMRGKSFWQPLAIVILSARISPLHLPNPPVRGCGDVNWEVEKLHAPHAMRLVRDGIIIGAVHRPALPGPQSSAGGSSQGLSRCQELFFSPLSSPLTEELIRSAFIIRTPNTAKKKQQKPLTITDAIGCIIMFIQYITYA